MYFLTHTATLWAGFLLLIGALLALDLGVFHRKAETPSIRSALGWTAIWIAVATSFSAFIYPAYEGHWLGVGLTPGSSPDGATAVLHYLTAYVVEKSLSLDNIFVISLVFAHFKIPTRLQHRVLYWGIVGAIILRGVLIITGTALVQRFSWTLYIFGVLLVYSAIKLAVTKEEDHDIDESWAIRLARRFFPVVPLGDSEHFFVRQANGVRAITPLFLALVLVETSDVAFAVDSIPAVFAVTTDPFIVFTSNIFAILGLRSLYFALGAMLDRFEAMKHSLVAILGYVGVKMLIVKFIHIPAWFSLCFILAALAVGMFASPKAPKDPETPSN